MTNKIEWCFDKGTILKLRCGGEIVAHEMRVGETRIKILDKDGNSICSWGLAGNYMEIVENHPLDIIEVIPPPKPRSGTVWLNVYVEHYEEFYAIYDVIRAVGYDTKEEAEERADKDDRKVLVRAKPVQWTEGETMTERNDLTERKGL